MPVCAMCSDISSGVVGNDAVIMVIEIADGSAVDLCGVCYARVGLEMARNLVPMSEVLERLGLSDVVQIADTVESVPPGEQPGEDGDPTADAASSDGIVHADVTAQVATDTEAPSD
jgi:hypothetical protein